MTKTITTIVDRGKGTPQIMIRNRRLNGLPLRKKTTTTQNRKHVFPTTIGRHPVRPSTSPRTVVAGTLVRAVTIAPLEPPTAHFSPTTTCGTNRRQLVQAHHRKRSIPPRMMSPRNILPHHHQWQNRLPRNQLKSPSRAILPVTQSTTSKRSNPSIRRSFLPRHPKFLPRAKSHLLKRTTTTCSMPRRTRKRPPARPRPPLLPPRPYRSNPSAQPNSRRRPKFTPRCKNSTPP